MVNDSVKQFEYKIGRLIEVFECDNGVVRSAKAKLVYGKFNRQGVKLAPVFYDGDQEIKNRKNVVELAKALVGATSKEQQKPSDSQKQFWILKKLEFDKTQNWSKTKSFTSLDRK